MISASTACRRERFFFRTSVPAWGASATTGVEHSEASPKIVQGPLGTIGLQRKLNLISRLKWKS
jgi:hypothetical protein